jgi:MFS family permease
MNIRYLKETPRRQMPEMGQDPRSILIGSYKEMFNVVRRLPVNLKAYAVMLALGFLFNGAVSSYWVIYGTEVMGFSELQWGTLLLVAASVNVVLLIPAGLITDRFGAERIIILSLTVVAVPTLLFPYSTSYGWTLLLFSVMTVANTFLMAAAPSYMAHKSPPDMRGRVMAALGMGLLFVDTSGSSTGGGPGMGALLTVPSIIGSMLGGIIYNLDPKLPWLLLGSSMLLNAILAFIFIRRR